MKNTFYTFIAILAITFSTISPASAQKAGPVTDTIFTGPGYLNEVYYSMAAGNKGTVDRKQWDIAFRTSRMSASILTNDAANNSALGVNGVELYTYPASDTSGWAAVDTTGLSTWKLMINSTTEWETGAFCQNQKGHPDYGWGKYNASSHDVVGDSLYVIKLRDGSYRKLWIMRKYSSDNVFKFRFANLDGTNDNTVMLDCNPYSARNFVGFSLITNEAVNFEPVDAAQWDILFTKYMYTYPEGPNFGAIYPVTGVLSNYKVKVNRFEHVAPDFRMFDPASMDSTRSPIGWEWKVFNNSTFTFQVVDSLVHFVQDRGGNIHRLVFKHFAGSSTGRIILEKEMISATTVGEFEKSDMNAAVYPNPVSDVMNVVVNPGNAKNVAVAMHDMSGRTVFASRYDMPVQTLSTIRIPVSNTPRGMYIVRIQAGEDSKTLKVLVK